ncbi:pentapeptide repeat-containing protein [Micromonospora sp. C95]|uniref:pentapeptide repeat-containing protein n=1 Tax=Micromonospora sp. C95 TaxID=2824882 RepID=UPI001B390AB3|nr:pentapeptide repeat-containing protein [Micromonospora sp. C95]MBQ1024493.1 pentapeptide repeat-containing protein [Micromonospora sp. C95]
MLVLGVVLGGGLVALWLLETWASRQGGMSPEAGAKLRLEAIRTALTVAAGLGAGATLLVALRRQSISERSQQYIERSQRFAEEDAREQRITALYVAAAEQLGSDKAAVRLAGMYALERLGQDNPKLRQTVVEVFCAYLRMPYLPPVEVLRAKGKASPQDATPDAEVPETEQQRREELQVRLTAQRLIATHLRMSASSDGAEPVTYWRGAAGERMNLDLVGATLTNFSLSSCHVERLDLAGTRFHGEADLNAAQFHGEADLNGAQFHGEADLRETQFHGNANLHGALFHRNVYLGEAQFHGDTYLHRAQFHWNAYLSGAQFHSNAYLGEAQFHRNAYLRWVRFHGNADLAGVRFHEDATADLREAQFHGNADLREALFHGDAVLTGALFHGDADLRGAEFHADAYLRRAQFDRGLDLAVWATPAAQLPPGWVLRYGTDTKGGLRPAVRVDDGAPAPDDHSRPAGDVDTGSDAA